VDGNSSIIGRDRHFSLHHRVYSSSGVYWISCAMGTGSSFSGIKRPGREARHSPPSGAEIKNSSYTSTFPTRLLCVVLGLNTESVSMAWCLV